MYCYLKCCFSIQNSYSSGKELKSKIAQKIKALAAIPDKVSSTHMVEKKTDSCKFTSDLNSHMHIYIQKTRTIYKK